jgi:P27 family predicted phage terminase small subunit
MGEKKTIPIRGGFPMPPSHLDAVGRDAWDMGLQLWLDGTITPRDLSSWTLFAEAYQEKAHCEAIVKRDGEYSVAMNGCFVQHPAIKRRQQAENVIRKYSQAFGLIPDARKKRPSVQQGVIARKKT